MCSPSSAHDQLSKHLAQDIGLKDKQTMQKYKKIKNNFHNFKKVCNRSKRFVDCKATWNQFFCFRWWSNFGIAKA